MDPKKQLRLKAIERANEIQTRALDAKKKLAKLQAELLQAQITMDGADLASQRALNADLYIEGIPHCPDCYVARSDLVPLTRIDGTKTAIHFRCRSCNHQFELQVD